MDVMRFEEEETRRDGKTNINVPTTNFCCGETRDHVHYPPRQRARSPLSYHSPTFSSGFHQKSPAAGTPRYRECLKNRAAGVGGTAYDGCCEFASDGCDSLKCAACGCDRSFHRIELAEEPIHHHHRGGGAADLGSLKTLPLHFHQSTKAKPSGDGGEGSTKSPREDRSPSTAVVSKKRFRTKFTAEQKEKMTEFAEELGWKMNKERHEEIEKFCAEVGVKREVFKVWMNNHKIRWK